jgi:predicted SAM-dependent methyltransferase
MSSVGIAGVKSRLKRALLASLPERIVNAVLTPWRKIYWWKKRRISNRSNSKIATALVRTGKPIKLELGSSRRLGMEDWTASDIGGGGDLQLDLTQPLPFPDRTVERIYSSHVLEHFSYPKPMLDLLRECYRVLIPGGSISLAVPNARIFLDGYFQPEKFDKERYCSYDVGLSYRSRIDFVNFIAYMGGDHKHLFDEENLPQVLSEVGFKDSRLRAFDPALDLEVRRHESIYAIAYK